MHSTAGCTGPLHTHSTHPPWPAGTSPHSTAKGYLVESKVGGRGGGGGDERREGEGGRVGEGLRWKRKVRKEKEVEELVISGRI